MMNICLCTFGKEPIQMLTHFNFDLSMLGADGIRRSPGFTTMDYSEVTCKNYIVIHAARSIVVTDVSKFNKKASCSLCTYTQINTLIINPFSEEQLARPKIYRTSFIHEKAVCAFIRLVTSLVGEAHNPCKHFLQK
jgi:DeoR/GlpR family transcriptional regulator of sugar metabolism